MGNPTRGELPDYVKFQCMRQLNSELLERLKKAHAEIERLVLLLEVNGEARVEEGVGDTEEGQREELIVQEVEGEVAEEA
jgi:hypothetical protein